MQRYDPRQNARDERVGKKKKRRKNHGGKNQESKNTSKSTIQFESNREGAPPKRLPESAVQDVDPSNVIDDIDLIDPTILDEKDGDAEVEMGLHQHDVKSLAPADQEIASAMASSKLPLRKVANAWKLAPFLIDNLERDGFQSFFPVQALSIPEISKSENVRVRDVCIAASTGSGKTLAYLLPILNSMSKRLVRRLSALIILPSRDLALQVHKVLERYVNGSPLKVGLAVGQSDFEAEQMALTVNQDAPKRDTCQQRLKIDRGNLDLVLDSFGDANGLEDPTNHTACESPVDIVVCTPGRLIDHLDQTPGFTLQYLEFLVVDEADKLLSERYQNWIDRVLSPAEKNAGPSGKALVWPNRMAPSMDTWTGHQRRNNFYPSVMRKVQLRKFLVSATMTRDPQKLASLRLVNPKVFDANAMSGTQSDASSEKFVLPPTLQEFTVECTAEQKPVVLCAAILEHQRDSAGKGIVVVFASTVESTHRLTRLLQMLWKESGNGDPKTIAEFSSALSQEDRTGLVERCSRSDGGLRIVVCSDSMSRGIDIESVELVINYDVPNLTKTYIHRCGRTGRAGKSGKSVTLLRNDQVAQFRKMRRSALDPERVSTTNVDKGLARSIIAVYRSCLSALRELLEAESHGELGKFDPLPSENY